ncbi:hypothetical protein THRCLA_03744 [Thraustotheca clavata]|uniref:Uncharacterized protein n=1 Tax=Thraustotheca clavata TaxID=74557 RepID=A0A1W0A142_9STRA|nr:hypothetical protein THRCLA_03744 [Thraustotheca clavata]
MDRSTEERKSHQRLRNRLKQVRHRHRYVNERAQLLAQISAMTELLATLEQQSKVPNTLLSWKAVASGLATSTVESKVTLVVLKDECNKMLQTARCMLAWIGSMRQDDIGALDRPFGWLEITLSADLTARKLGLDWYTQHLYHNTDRMLEFSSFPAQGSFLDSQLLDCGNDLVDLLGRIQIEYNKPIEEVYNLLQDKIWADMRGDTMPFFSEILDEELVSSIDPKMLYRRTPIQEDESDYDVCREFDTDDRIVFLLGNFAQDALQPVNRQWRPGMLWFVLERIDQEHSRLRGIYFQGPRSVGGQLVTWKESLYKLDMDVSKQPVASQFQAYKKWICDKVNNYLQVDFESYSLQTTSLCTPRTTCLRNLIALRMYMPTKSFTWGPFVMVRPVKMDRRKLEQAMRNRLKQKRHRERFGIERSQLLTEIKELKIALFHLRRQVKAQNTLLPWEAIADSLAQATVEAKSSVVALKQQQIRLVELCQNLSAWVTTMSRTNNLPEARYRWTEVNLVAELRSRVLGLDWFSKQLYHNTDYMLQLCQMPYSGSVADALILDSGDGYSELLGRIQREYNSSLEVVYQALHHVLWGECCGDYDRNVSEILDNELSESLQANIVYYRQAISAEESNFFVGREFKSEDRIVFLSGNFTQDESFSKNMMWRPRFFWYIIERIGPKQTRLRAVLYNGPPFPTFAIMADPNKQYQLLRNRRKQQRFRERYVNECQEHRSRIEELSKVIAELQKRGKPSTLPWKAIAGSLAQARVESRLTLEVLKCKAEKMHRVARVMTSWIEEMTKIPMQHNVFNWTEITLLAEPETRKLGLDWFTQHLYHNTDRIAQLSVLPFNGDVQDIMVVKNESEYIDVIGRIQIIYDRPLKATYEALQEKIWSKIRGDTFPMVSLFLDHDLVQSISPKMLYRRAPLTSEESNYYVSREFFSDNRVVFLVGNFNQDGLQPTNQQWRARLFWYILEEMPENQSRLRVISFTGPNIVHGKAVSWKDDLNWLGYENESMSENVQLEQYQKLLHELYQPVLQSDYNFFASSDRVTSREECRKQHLRLRNRLKQKRHRDRYLNEKSQLLGEISKMTHALNQLKHRHVFPTTLLPWKDVAACLAQASVESRISLEFLKERCESMHEIGRVMSLWVGAMTRFNNIPMVPDSLAPVPTILLADPVARKLGLEWFSLHMYHNTDRMVEQCAFPTTGNVSDMLVLDRGEGLADILGRIQVDNDMSLEESIGALHDKIWAEMRGDTHPCPTHILDTELVQAIDPKMLYRRTALDEEESNYYVCREFKSENRVVYLFGNFNQDALQPLNLLWRPRMFWYIFERRGKKSTRINAIFYNGPKVDRGQVRTWKKVLHNVGIDVQKIPEEKQFSEYKQLIHCTWTPLIKSDLELLTLQGDGTIPESYRSCFDMLWSATLSQPLAWVDTTLVADREARKHGMDWFSKHLYHNTDRMVQFADFPTDNKLSGLKLVDTNDGGYNAIGRIQDTYNLPLKQVYEALQERIWSTLRGETFSAESECLDQDLTQSIDKDMLYRRSISSADEANYYICRVFHSEDRIIFLMGNFSQDALQPKNRQWRSRMFWYILERTSPNTTRLRGILYNAPYIVDGKMVTWKDELTAAGLADPNLSDEDNFRRYKSIASEACEPIIVEELAGLQIDRYVAQLMAEWVASMIPLLEEKKKEHQRMMNRIKQKRHRHRYKLERQDLRDQAQTLTTRLATLKTIKQMDEIIFRIRKNLINECRSTQHLSQAMTEWVAWMIPPVPKTLSQPFVWAKTTLVADREARKLGMDWFSRHLYHNTDRMVQFAEFPIDNKLADVKVIDVNDGEYNIIGHIQNMYNLPLKQTYEALKEQLWSTLRGDTYSGFSTKMNVCNYPHWYVKRDHNQMKGVMSTSELIEKKKEHQRMRNRMKQKRHRHRHLLERQNLHDQAQALTTSLATLRKIKDKDEILFTTRKNLLDEYRSTRYLAHVMTEWVATMIPPVPKTLSQPFAWVKTALVADREARKLGMDWFSQHLHHNTDRMVQFANFPTDNKLLDTVVEVVGGEHNVIGRIQTSYNLPLEQTYEALKEQIWSTLRGDKNPFVSEFLDQDLTQAIDKEMLYRRAVLSVDEANYYVCRVFHSEDRIVFLMGNFNEDALLPKNRHWRPRMV